MCDRHGVSRKSFLTGLGALVAAALTPDVASAAARVRLPYGTVRELWVRSAQTGAELRAYLTIDGHTVFTGTQQYPGYIQICGLMRDFHNGTEAPIDVNLLEGMWELQQVLTMMGYRAPLEIISAYRTAETNADVGGVPKSLHMRGAALDFVVPGVSIDTVWRAAVSRKIVGGIGKYSAHVHIDSGPRVYWSEDAP